MLPTFYRRSRSCASSFSPGLTPNPLYAPTFYGRVEVHVLPPPLLDSHSPPLCRPHTQEVKTLCSLLLSWAT